MQPCTKRKCTGKDPSIIMNFIINDFKKINDEAIRDAINFTATIAHFIALYEHYYMDKSDDTKRLLISIDNDVMCFKDKFNSIYSIRNYKYEILKTHINEFNKNIKSKDNLEYDSISDETINDIKSKIISINNEIEIFNSTKHSMNLNISTIKLYRKVKNA
jgi:hypothetical protein